MVRTIVTSEPEWSDFERDKMLALAEYEAGICGCGMHKSIADTDPDLEMTERICPVCADLAKNLRIYADRDKKAINDKTPPEQPRPDDGRHLGIKMKTPSEGAGISHQGGENEGNED